MIRINGKDVAVGMTTCPRSESYIQESINSLIDNGWGVPLVYSDDDMRGDFWGFLQVGRLLLNAYPLADGYIILQDDIVACMKPVCPGISKLPITDFGLVSLFTMHPDLESATASRHRAAGRPVSLHEMKISTPRERANNCNGGIAYYVERSFLNGLLLLPHAKYTPTPSVLGEICNEFGSEYLVSPVNIFEHTGEISSLHPDKPEYRWDVTNATQFRKPQ
jgi:hypothetical protein